MSEREPDYAGTVYDCPVCGGDASIEFENGATIVCDKCGKTKILLSFKSNGDMVTVSENNGQYYEVEPDVRAALAKVEAAKASKPEGIQKSLAIISANNDLATAYNNTGREGLAENLASESLKSIGILFEGGEEVVEEYCDQASLCVAFASARSDYDLAQKIYDSALIDMDGIKSVSVASLKVKRGLLWTKKDNAAAETHLKDALEIIGDGDTKEYPDPYIRVIAYDALRGISGKRMDPVAEESYLIKSIEERKRLLDQDPDAPEYRVVELVDAMGYYAEKLSRGGDDNMAEDLLKDAEEIARKYNRAEAEAYAVMSTIRYQQNMKRPLPDNFSETMTKIIDTFVASPAKDKRLKESLAQAYMFRSMVIDPEDYDALVSDIGNAYDLLLDLAYRGDVNEMFLMSAARSYLILLNMKNPEKAKSVRQELNEIGISQKHLDTSARSTIGNSGKRTKVDYKEKVDKPLPGRRLKRQPIKKKE